MAKKTGRPKKILSERELESVKYMAMIHCTGEEIAGVLGIDYDTLNRIIKEKFNMGIAEFLRNNNSKGKMSLRRAQWAAAESGNVTMLIFLGKQWLGQTDRVEQIVTAVDEETKAKVEALIDEAAGHRKRKGNS